MAAFGIAIFAAILFGSLAFETALAVKQPKVTICHVDPDDDGAGNETLEVNRNSLAKHLAHGDGEGACLTCGNGLEEAGEECDAGGQNSDIEPDACRTTCQLATCGDSVVDTPEQCDDGNNDDTDGCLNSCEVAMCGDGVVQTGIEQCDDGNTTPGDGCDESCQIESGADCGNDVIEPGETCDDGTANGTPGFCNLTCDDIEPFVCGNDVIDPGEECDGTNLGGETCESVGNGFNLEGNLQGNDKGYLDGLGPGPGDGLACSAFCTFDTSACFDV